jgi:hypothetical protein
MALKQKTEIGKEPRLPSAALEKATDDLEKPSAVDRP